MTSGSSNCEDTPQGLAEEQRVFMKVNRVSLEKDADSGTGRTLYAFAELLGCDADESKKEFFELSQEHFDEIFSGTDEEALKNFGEIIRERPALVEGCVNLV
jgi:hypothetical protein